MYKEGDYTPDALRNLKIGYESLFIEVPIVIRNSPLTNIMMSELQEMIPEEEGSKFLDLGTSSVLEGLYLKFYGFFQTSDNRRNKEVFKMTYYKNSVVDLML
jgi:translation initiation factor 3 subunit H